MLSFENIKNWLKNKQKILCITHRNPDGDAIGSLFGLQNILQENNFECDIYLRSTLPELYHKFR